MNIKDLSKHYEVNKLSFSDVNDIYLLCKDNKEYYEYCPPFVTNDSIKEDLEALPPGISINNKYFVGFYDNDKLIAIMDLIDGYPNSNALFIGLLMVNINYQNKGIGSRIVNDLSKYAKDNSYKGIRLAWIKENSKAERFWKKNGFNVLCEKRSIEDNPKTVIEATKLL